MNDKDVKRNLVWKFLNHFLLLCRPSPWRSIIGSTFLFVLYDSMHTLGIAESEPHGVLIPIECFSESTSDT